MPDAQELKQIKDQKKTRARKVKKIILRVCLTCLGIFLLGYGIIAMLFNFKVGLAITAVGAGILFVLLYRAYNP